MGWLIDAVCLVGGIVYGIASTRFFGRRVYRNSRMIWDDHVRYDQKLNRWVGGLVPNDDYDDSSYDRRDSPHASDYAFGAVLMLVGFAAWPIWLITVGARRHRSRRINRWKTLKKIREEEAELAAKAKAEAEEIVNELNQGRTT